MVIVHFPARSLISRSWARHRGRSRPMFEVPTGSAGSTSNIGSAASQHPVDRTSGRPWTIPMLDVMQGAPLKTKPEHEARKTSLALVLKSLTRSHRELVQVIAEHQLEAGGRTGISQSRLLSEATDRMIASTTTVLKSLLNELRDHEVVALRGAVDGGTLLYLTCDAKVLARLAKGQEPEESEEESEQEIDVEYGLPFQLGFTWCAKDLGKIDRGSVRGVGTRARCPNLVSPKIRREPVSQGSNTV